MTTVTIPSLERRFLEIISEEMELKPVREWTPWILDWCLDSFRKMRQSARELRHELEEFLASGAEARSFAREHSQFLPIADDLLTRVRTIAERLSPAGDAGSKSLADELNLLESEFQAFRDLLAEALSRASAARRPVNWERVREAEEAYARGETKPFCQR